MADVKLKAHPFTCPECGGGMYLIYRHMGSDIRCVDCGHRCAQSAAKSNAVHKPTDKEIIRTNAALLREAAKYIKGLAGAINTADLGVVDQYHIDDLIQRLEEAGKE